MEDELHRGPLEQRALLNRKKGFFLLGLGIVLVLLAFASIFIGSAHLGFAETFNALFGNGSSASVTIVQQVRLPRMIAALVVGGALSLSGLIMQSTLHNPMASPSTLGVSNAAAFGANVAIIVFAGGFLSVGGNANNYGVGSNPFTTSSFALLFAVLSTLLVLALCRIRSFSSEAVVLAGIALGMMWTAGTTVLQFYATDVGLAASILWSFGDLGRANWTNLGIMGGGLLVAIIVFCLLSWRLNALSSGDDVATSFGIRVRPLRFIALFLSSLLTAVAVSFVGIIGFLGVVCPHAMRRIIGNNHKYLIPASILSGSLLLLLSDILVRLIGNGTVLPVGAVTALFGGPFFVYLIFAKKGDKA